MGTSSSRRSRSRLGAEGGWEGTRVLWARTSCPPPTSPRGPRGGFVGSVESGRGRRRTGVPPVAAAEEAGSRVSAAREEGGGGTDTIGSPLRTCWGRSIGGGYGRLRGW